MSSRDQLPRPGTDPTNPHCDIWLDPSHTESQALFQLASLHRAAQVARFRWKQQNPEEASLTSSLRLPRMNRSRQPTYLAEARSHDRRELTRSTSPRTRVPTGQQSTALLDSGSDSGSATDEDVILLTLRSAAGPASVTTVRQNSTHTLLYDDDETDLEAWDRLVDDLNVGADSSDNEETQEQHYANMEEPISGIAAALLSQQPQNDQGGSASHFTMPHPVWSRRYKGAAGMWLRTELTRVRRGRLPIHEYLGYNDHSTTFDPSDPTEPTVFPALDPEDRLAPSNEDSRPTQPAESVQASNNWASLLLPSNATAQLTNHAASYVRNTEVLNAHQEVARMAQAARVRAQSRTNTYSQSPGRPSSHRPRSTRDAMAFLERLRALDGLTSSTAAAAAPPVSNLRQEPDETSFPSTTEAFDPDGADVESVYRLLRGSSAQVNHDPDGECVLNPPESRARRETDSLRRLRNRSARVISDNATDPAADGWTLVGRFEAETDSLMVLNDTVLRTSPLPYNESSPSSGGPSRSSRRHARRSELVPSITAGSNTSPWNRLNTMSQVGRSEQWSGSQAERDFQALLSQDEPTPTSTQQEDAWRVCR